MLESLRAKVWEAMKIQLDEVKIPKVEIEDYKFIENWHARLFILYSEIVKNTEIGREVVKGLSEDPRVISLQGKLVSSGNGATSFDVDTLAMWFIWCVNQYGFEKSFDYLNLYLDSDKIPALAALWVLGVDINQRITLNGDYIILPIKEMPESVDKGRFLRIHTPLEIVPQPSCAITKDCAIQKALPGDGILPEEINREFHVANRRMNDIALVLNALDGICCIPYYSSSYIAPTTPLGLFGGYGGGYSIYDVITQVSAKLPGESKALIDTLLTKYENLDITKKGKIQRILDRLSQSKRREQIEDKMLDLGIALEMLLLDGCSPYDPLSLSFRLRGSWLLGKSADERIEIAARLKDIYEYRSQVAHGGVIAKGDAKIKEHVGKMYSKYQSLAAEICQKILIDGDPNWSRLLFGG